MSTDPCRGAVARDCPSFRSSKLLLRRVKTANFNEQYKLTMPARRNAELMEPRPGIKPGTSSLPPHHLTLFDVRGRHGCVIFIPPTLSPSAGLNRGPFAYHANALPTELLGQRGRDQLSPVLRDVGATTTKNLGRFNAVNFFFEFSQFSIVRICLF